MEGIASHILKHCCLPLRSLLLLCLTPAAWCDESVVIKNNIPSYTTTYSDDVADIDRFNHRWSEKKSNRNATPDLSWKSKSGLSQKQVSSFVYKAFNDPKKVAEAAAAAAAFAGLEALGAARPLKEGMEYIQKKTRFNFGKCGKVKISSKLKAESCLMDNSKVELNSDYKLDSVTVKFKWSM
ncbi:MAG: hypothetical protein ACR2PT_08090 [Endozoicomonas sp.]